MICRGAVTNLWKQPNSLPGSEYLSPSIGLYREGFTALANLMNLLLALHLRITPNCVVLRQNI